MISDAASARHIRLIAKYGMKISGRNFVIAARPMRIPAPTLDLMFTEAG